MKAETGWSCFIYCGQRTTIALPR